MSDAAVEGELASWRQHGPSGWGVGRVRGADGTLTAIVGVILGAREGYTIRARGTVKHDPRWGAQVVITEAELSPPESVDGALAWLAATLPNIGVARARRMVEWCGGVEALWACIEHTPERLAMVDGISPVRAAELHAAYMLARADREHAVTLRGWGLTTAQIGQCKRTWLTAEHSVERIAADPYELFRRVHGFGWTRADAVARRSGIQLDSPLRIAAGIEHVLAEHADAGHVSMRPRMFQAEVERVLSAGRDVVMCAIRKACRDGVIVKRGPRIYSGRLDQLESALAASIGARVAP